MVRRARGVADVRQRRVGGAARAADSPKKLRLAYAGWEIGTAVAYIGDWLVAGGTMVATVAAEPGLIPA